MSTSSLYIFFFLNAISPYSFEIARGFSFFFLFKLILYIALLCHYGVCFSQLLCISNAFQCCMPPSESDLSTVDWKNTQFILTGIPLRKDKTACSLKFCVNLLHA